MAAPTVLRYTERAEKVLILAKEEAIRFHHNYLGTEHLLVGLVAVQQGVAGKVFHSLGIDVAGVREAMIHMLAPSAGPTVDDPPLAPRAERALAFAAQEAVALGHKQIGTEHLLLGLTRTDDQGPATAQSAAISLLRLLDIDLENLRRQVIQFLSTGRTRDHVVSCRVTDRVLEALDAFVEAGVNTTRSEAAARLIVAGIEANPALLEKVYAAAAQIRRVRTDTQTLTHGWALPAANPASLEDSTHN